MTAVANVAMLACVLLAGAGGGGPASRPVSAPAGSGEMVKLQFPENCQVKLLVEYVSRRTGVNILYDDAAVQKKVTISSPTEVPAESLMGLLQGVLKMSGLAMVDADQAGWKRIVEAKDLLAIAGGPQEDSGQLAEAPAARVMTQVFKVESVPAGQVEQTVKPFLSSPGGNMFVVESRNLLVVTDYAGNLRRMAEMVRLLDCPGPPVRMHFVPAEHWLAADLSRQVGSLLEGRRGPGGKAGGAAVTVTFEPHTNQVVVIAPQGQEAEALELAKQLDVPSGAVTEVYRFRYVSPQRVERIARDLAGGERVKDRYSSAVDEQSGMLIVTAPPDVQVRIAELREQLDVPESEAAGGQVRFYKLMNTTASAVLATIRSLEGGEEALLAAEGAGASGAAPGASATTRPSETFAPGSEKFTGPNAPPPADPGAVPPPPPAYKPQEAVAARPPGEARDTGAAARPKALSGTHGALVTVDANTNTLIVVAPPSVQRLYEQLISMLDRRRPQVMIEATLVTLDTSGGFSLGVDVSHAGSVHDRDYLVFSSFGLSTVDPLTGSLAIVPGVGFNGALIGPAELNAVVKALATSGRAEVLSAPRVLVNDNATATLTSVSEAPFTSVNASDTVSTTSFAGYASAGSTLTVTPHISEGDHLQLSYSVTLNSFTGKGGGGIPPPRQTNSLTSDVTVPDGYAVVVGGLKRKDNSHTASKVPLLGDVPVLGALFGLTSDSNTESTLFAFIRPVILRDDRFEDLKYLSQRDLDLAGLPANLPTGQMLIMD